MRRYADKQDSRTRILLKAWILLQADGSYFCILETEWKQKLLNNNNNNYNRVAGIFWAERLSAFSLSAWYGKVI